jgi:hypothetical protein
LRSFRRRRIFRRGITLLFILLSFIFGIKFNSILSKKPRQVELVDVGKYEADFSEVTRLLSINTLALSGIAETVSNTWIRSISQGQDSGSQLEKVFSALENSGQKSSLSDKNELIELGLKRLKNYPFKYREAYNILEDTYTSYLQFFKLSLNPSGSLVIYNKKVNELEEDLARNFIRLNLYAPKVAAKKNEPAVPVQAAVAARPLSRDCNENDLPGLAPAKINYILGKNLADVEKIMGAPLGEIYAQASDYSRKEYKYNGKKIIVYFKNDQVAGFSD